MRLRVGRHSRQEFLAYGAKLAVFGLAAAWPQREVQAATTEAPYQQGAARLFYQWYCQRFCNFEAFLSADERRYVGVCLDLMSEWAHELADGVQLSTMSFSHAVRGNKVNSTRMAHGSLKNRALLLPDLWRVLHHHRVREAAIPDAEGIAGIGWDLEAGATKVYTFLEDVATTRDPVLQDLLARHAPLKQRRFGCTSYTFKEGRLVERKVYVHAGAGLVGERGADFAAAVLHTTYMLTSERGVVPQYDLVKGRFVAERHINGAGQAIMGAYQATKWPLDTIAYQDRENFTLYV